MSTKYRQGYDAAVEEIIVELSGRWVKNPRWNERIMFSDIEQDIRMVARRSELTPKPTLFQRFRTWLKGIL